MKQTTSILAMMASLLIAAAPAAHAQGGAEPRTVASVSVGGQVITRTFASNVTFTDFGETGTVAANQSVGRGLIVDLNGKRKLWTNFGIGVGLWFGHEKGSASAVAAIPNPLIVGQPTIVSATATDLARNDLGIDIQLFWMRPIRDRLWLTLAGGPTILHVSQDIGTITVTPNTQNAAPGTISQSATSGKAGNIGADLSYMVNTKYGGGVFVRYAGGEVDLPAVPKMKVGGLQIGGGIRIHF